MMVTVPIVAIDSVIQTMVVVREISVVGRRDLRNMAGMMVRQEVVRTVMVCVVPDSVMQIRPVMMETARLLVCMMSEKLRPVVVRRMKLIHATVVRVTQRI